MSIQLPLTDLRLILRVLEEWLQATELHLGFNSEEVDAVAISLRLQLKAHDDKKAAYVQHLKEQEAAKAGHFKHDARYDRIAEVSTLEQAARYEALEVSVKCITDLPPAVQAA